MAAGLPTPPAVVDLAAAVAARECGAATVGPRLAAAELVDLLARVAHDEVGRHEEVEGVQRVAPARLQHLIVQLPQLSGAQTFPYV